ncbi:MAG TPA: hypothetical protein VG164_03940 [Trebonia sp.]|jgi:hypothetical protein|nr:hypothetical protein [Trebonia sp.]
MSLTRDEQRALAAIETRLLTSRPEFTDLFAVLATRAPGQVAAREFLSPWRERRRRPGVTKLLFAVIALLVACATVGLALAGLGGPPRGRASVGTRVSSRRPGQAAYPAAPRQTAPHDAGTFKPALNG